MGVLHDTGEELRLHAIEIHCLEADVRDDVEWVPLAEDDLVHAQLILISELSMQPGFHLHENVLLATHRRAGTHCIPRQVRVRVGTFARTRPSVVIGVTDDVLASAVVPAAHFLFVQVGAVNGQLTIVRNIVIIERISGEDGRHRCCEIYLTLSQVREQQTAKNDSPHC